MRNEIYQAQTSKPGENPDNVMRIRAVGSFHVGGRSVTLGGLPERDMPIGGGDSSLRVDPNGDFEVEQMYAQYILLEEPKARYPMLMVHGGGLCGTTWETKPDGRPGWQQFFLQAGYDVYVSDAVERGRASWARYPEVFQSEPFFRTKKEAWETFRIGPLGGYRTRPSMRIAEPGTLFPIEAFDQLAKQSMPRWPTNDAAIQAAYDAYLRAVGPCVVVVHSQGGNFMLNAALHVPGTIKAMVVIEPTGTPYHATADLSALKNVPILFVWGDYVESNPFWKNTRDRVEQFRQRMLELGGIADVLNLPAGGISGNSHMLMMDRNSDDIARMVQRWLAAREVMK
jgi:pimeloyl-ACP methyl ester carboxylesterase